MKRALVFLLIVSGWMAFAQQAPAPVGAWMPVNVKWLHAPPDVAPNLETTSTTVFYFKPNGTMIKVGCVVDRLPSGFTISAGDGQVLSVGDWQKQQGKIVAHSQVVMRTVERIGEKLPGPWEREVLTVKKGQLFLEGVPYQRVPELDKSASEMLPHPDPAQR